VDIRRTRHALACGLIADAVGLLGAIGVAYLFYR
jgi:spore maturation protein SpmB